MKSPTSFIPAYHRLAVDLKTKIETGELKPGDTIPSEAQLASQYGVSRMTVRQGMRLLTDAGYIEPVQGKGSFVSAPRMDRLMLQFPETDILGETQKPKAKLLAVDVVTAEEQTARKLQVPRNSKVMRIKRILSTGEGPAALDIRYLPYVKGRPLLEKEIEYAAFPDLVARHTELVSVRNNLAVSATSLSAEEAKILEAEVGLPALCIEQILYASGDRPLGWSKMICRGDRYVLTAVSYPYSER